MTRNEHIHFLIERYFEATATPSEERELKHILADSTIDATPEVEEARAMMGYTAISKAVATPPRRRNRVPRLISIAASIALVAFTSVTLVKLMTNNHDADTATIYANGMVIESTDQAMSMMQSQLKAMGQATEASEAAGIFNALEAMRTTDHN